jgi:hypothetical protein
MSEKPVIFSPPMVRVILDGKKTMAQRVIKEPVRADKNGFISIKGFGINPKRDTGTAFRGIAPYNIGDVLWARERFAETLDGEYLYLTDPVFDGCGKGDFGWDWKPSIHMPRKAARVFLEVSGIRVERFREITAADKTAEGFSDCRRVYPCAGCNECVVPCFMKFWDSLNAKCGYRWDVNSWVFVISFKVK